jgi:hypothetical protein
MGHYPRWYCLKDFGQPHFQMVTQGISDEHLINWRHDYRLIQNLFVERKEITKTNCFKLSTNFYDGHLCPLPPEHLTLNCTFWFMVNSQSIILQLTGPAHGRAGA